MDTSAVPGLARLLDRRRDVANLPLDHATRLNRYVARMLSCLS